MKLNWFYLIGATGFLIQTIAVASGKALSAYQSIIMLVFLVSLLLIAAFEKKKTKVAALNPFEITERLSELELRNKANELELQYVNGMYQHKNGECYAIVGITTININQTSYWGFIYRKCDRSGRVQPLFTFHTRPIYEFLDGRFEEVA